MTDIILSSAQRILLQRAADAGADGFEIAPRARASATILAGHGLLEGTGDVHRATPRGRRFLGMTDEAIIEGAVNRAPREGSKAAQVIALLQREEGATVSQMSEATGWLPHSVRGFLAGALKKTHGLTPTSEAAEGGRVYRLAAGAQA